MNENIISDQVAAQIRRIVRDEMAQIEADRRTARRHRYEAGVRLIQHRRSQCDDREPGFLERLFPDPADRLRRQDLLDRRASGASREKSTN
jgi:hypothetical protein